MFRNSEENHDPATANKRTSCYTYFRITGNFDPDTISELLGLTPERSWKIGDKHKSGHIYDCSSWQFGTCDAYDVYVENQMRKTITPLLSKISILKEIKQKYDAAFFWKLFPRSHPLKAHPVLRRLWKSCSFAVIRAPK